MVSGTAQHFARLQRGRWLSRSLFFALFVLAPPLDLFRFDLTLNHFILFGQPWTLGIDAFRHGEISSTEAVLNLFLRGFLPLFLIAALLIAVAWRYGRLYCGWLCPHFSVVEAINAMMLRTLGKPTLWERQPHAPHSHLLWPLTLLAIVGFAFIWALSLLTYLMPPMEVYSQLISGTLGRNQSLFLIIATAVFSLEFLLARHLFCRFGCAVGLFQSLAWMANRSALVVGFNRSQSRDCIDCNADCDRACPMRLKPRSMKRRMFTCTQCSLCMNACDQAQGERQRPPLLHWLDGECAWLISDYDLGHKPEVDRNCFSYDTTGLERWKRQ